MPLHIEKVEAHHIKKGGHILIKRRPCVIVSTKSSKTGKHGHVKVAFAGTDIFTGKKLTPTGGSLAGHMKVLEYELVRVNAEVIDLDADDMSVTVLDDDGLEQTYNIKDDNPKCDGLIEKYEALTDEQYCEIQVWIAPVLTSEGKDGEGFTYDEVAQIVGYNIKTYTD